MAYTEFSGENHRPRRDPDAETELFTPRKIGEQRRKALFKLTVPPGEGIVVLTAATMVSKFDEDDLDDLIEALQEARDYLQQ